MVCLEEYELLIDTWYLLAGYFQLPITLLYVTPFFDILGGGGVIFSSFIYGYIAESVDPKDLQVYIYSPLFYSLG